MVPILKKINACGMHLQCCALWIFVAITMPSTGNADAVGDSCRMKSQSGVCKLGSECPELEMAVRAGTLLTRDIVSCGFATHEEIICCPVDGGNRQSALSTTFPTVTTSTTTTEDSNRDFWSHLLTPKPNPETTTTAEPDFWLPLLSTTTTTTTTTTLTPLTVNGKEIDPNARFIDLTAILSDNNNQNDNDDETAEYQNLPTQIPKSINDRTNGWHNPPMGLPNPNVDWSVPPVKQFSNNFITGNNGFGQQPFQEPMQQNAERHFPKQMSFAFPNPSGFLDVRQPIRFPVDKQFIPMNQQSRSEHGFGPHQPHAWPANNNQNFNAPQQSKWQENNDFSQANPLSKSIWPSNDRQNAAMRFPPKEFSPSNPFFNQAVTSLSRTTRATFSVKSTKNLIEEVNENIKKAGIELISAKLENPQCDHECSRKTSTARDIIADRTFNPIWGSSKRSTRKPLNGREGSTRSTVTSSTTALPPVTPRSTDRPAVMACREIDAGLDPSLTPHILGGTPVEIGEFPHMAAIGYSSLGNDEGPYDYRCGGTLIASRFVLTAAHCVNSRNDQPAVVLLGLVNITDKTERTNAEEVPIRQVHIHPDYSSSSTYHDVAILELTREVRYSSFIYPTCLHADLNDPPPSSVLYVTGWGKIGASTRQKSNILLKAKLELVSIDQCNASYVENGLNRRISHGVQLQQMCAHDPGFTRDACQGDSGGPLNLVVDESLYKYRIIGIISAGFSCGSSTPGLYARVAAYLDFIERIVWPNQS